MPVADAVYMHNVVEDHHDVDDGGTYTATLLLCDGEEREVGDAQREALNDVNAMLMFYTLRTDRKSFWRSSPDGRARGWMRRNAGWWRVKGKEG